jgi:hypothetical protein
MSHELGAIGPKRVSSVPDAGGSPASFLAEHAEATPSMTIAMSERYFISRIPGWAVGVLGMINPSHQGLDASEMPRF